MPRCCPGYRSDRRSNSSDVAQSSDPSKRSSQRTFVERAGSQVAGASSRLGGERSGNRRASRGRSVCGQRPLSARSLRATGAGTWRQWGNEQVGEGDAQCVRHLHERPDGEVLRARLNTLDVAGGDLGTLRQLLLRPLSGRAQLCDTTPYQAKNAFGVGEPHPRRSAVMGACGPRPICSCYDTQEEVT
jgi:hypothetical protein